MNESNSTAYRSYAKINLYLDVLARRDDDFHSIETIFQTISLFDTLQCSPDDSEITLTIEGADLSPGEDNLVMRAAQLLRKRYDTAQGAHLQLNKRIPIAAGLAGGSGNAAAALIALNTMWGIDASLEELQTLGAELGSDIPYCLVGGTQAGIGRGEQLTALEPMRKEWFVLAHPPIAVSTQEIYHHSKLFKSGAVPGPTGMSSRLEEAIQRCEEAPLGSILFNAMESAALDVYPIIAEYKLRLKAAGCEGVLMSGSGPTVFGLCSSEAQANEVHDRLSEIESTVVHSVDAGVKVL